MGTAQKVGVAILAAAGTAAAIGGAMHFAAEKYLGIVGRKAAPAPPAASPAVPAPQPTPIGSRREGSTVADTRRLSYKPPTAGVPKSVLMGPVKIRHITPGNPTAPPQASTRSAPPAFSQQESPPPDPVQQDPVPVERTVPIPAAASDGSRVMQATAIVPVPGRTYTVEPGETLFDVARYELGNAARWTELYELNRETLGSDLDLLSAGTKLTLPLEVSNSK